MTLPFGRRQLLLYGSVFLGSSLVSCSVGAVGGSTQKNTQAGILTNIKSNGKVVVGTEAAYEPYEFVKDNKIVGYGPDILAHVVKALGVKLEQLDTPFSGILPGLLARKFNFVATALDLTEERAKKFAMTMPIMEGYTGILKLKENISIKTLDDLAGKRIGLATGSAQEKTAADLSKKLKQTKGQGILELKGFVSIPDSILALNNKQIDAVMDATDVLGATVAKHPTVYELIYKRDEPTYTCWATRSEDKDLRDFINTQIQQLQTSGELTKLQKKWFGYSVKLPTSDYLPSGAV